MIHQLQDLGKIYGDRASITRESSSFFNLVLELLQLFCSFQP